MGYRKILVVCTNSAGDRKLYSVMRNAQGQVFDWKQDIVVDFTNDNYLDYCCSAPYMGGDIFLASVTYNTTTIVYIQEGKEPSIYDKIYHVYGAEMPKEIPEKIRPMAPPVREPGLRPRSKVRADAYSDRQKQSVIP